MPARRAHSRSPFPIRASPGQQPPLPHYTATRTCGAPRNPLSAPLLPVMEPPLRSTALPPGLDGPLFASLLASSAALRARMVPPVLPSARAGTGVPGWLL